MSNWIAFQIAGDEGMPLVFLHGIGGDAESWRPQLDGFSKDYRAIAWDMPGYGDSAPLAEMTFPALVDTVSVLFDRLSVNQAHLVGHSLGGMIAQAFALAHPERLKSLTLAATSAAFGKRAGGEIDTDWRDNFIEQRLGPLDRGASMAELAPKLVKNIIGDELDPKGLEQAILSMASVPEAGYRAAIKCLAGFEQEEALGDIRTPTLLIAGEKDPVVPPKVMRRMADAMPDARLSVLEGSGHLVHLERPYAFNHQLGDFLKALVVH
ncbi:MAG: alpha/beta hydrolase [Pseudomonadota bacterium]